MSKSAGRIDGSSLRLSEFKVILPEPSISSKEKENRTGDVMEHEFLLKKHILKVTKVIS